MAHKLGTWTFDYSEGKNIYHNNIETYDKLEFKHYDKDEDYENDEDEKRIMDYRKAGIIHKQVREYARNLIVDGYKLSDFVDNIENKILELTNIDNKNKYFLKGDNKKGIAFPVGVNINNIVAHDSKMILLKDNRIFKKGDVIKVDFGIHINGRTVDSAFTHICTEENGISDENSIYKDLLEASREATFEGIKMSGPEQNILEISENIFEIINSYEIDIGGNIAKIKPVQSIGGHNIKDYNLHAGKLILSVPDEKIQDGMKMEDGEIYAIETFSSTGMGLPRTEDAYQKTTHFSCLDESVIDSIQQINSRDKNMLRKSDLYKWIKTRNGLPFASSWIPKGLKKVQKAFKTGLETGQIIAYPPIIEEENARVAQFEHTIRIKDGYTEIFSIGQDY